MGILPGSTEENIAVMAHTDSFFEGAMDNASGMATMVALAEHYAKIPKNQRRRTMTFFTTSAHHSPSGNNASIRWIHNNMKQMWSKTALLVNCEHTAQVATFLVGETLYGSNQVSARRWFVGGSNQLKTIVDEGLQGLRDGALSHVRNRGRAASSGRSSPTRPASTSSTRPSITPTWTR